ncbi:MAG: PhzF family phenazine biosynthesis protein [Nocardiaceae bacterium]|nr:PhzF family phenazine biosynthesis protein [Nocardiaceae bacterium]
MAIEVTVVRVFTAAHGKHGNELGIVAGEGFEPIQRQALAAALGFSETIFYVDIGDAAVARIHTPTVELPFAGHPSVGLAWWLSQTGSNATSIALAAGEVEFESENGLTWVRARAEWAPDFTFHPKSDASDIDELNPDDFTEGEHYAWAWTSPGNVRSRMFAPGLGVAEDEATGAAAVRLTSLTRKNLTITQGRGSQIFTKCLDDGWVELGGRTVYDRTIPV